MKFIELSAKLKETLSPVYLINGTDDFLIKQTVNNFKKVVLSSFAELNFHEFTDENYNAINIINACNGMPFGAEKKLVVATIAETVSKNDISMFLSYINNPNPQTIFLAISNLKDFFIMPPDSQINCDKLDQGNLQKLIVSKLKPYNKTITIPAANLLIQKCDYDAMKISTEIQKLSFFNEENIITAEVVELLVSNSFDLNVFNLTNALSIKDGNKVLSILKDMLDAKIEPNQIFSAITGNFRRMFISVISTSLTNEEIATQLKVKPYAVLKAKESARRFSVKNLKRINELLQEVEFKFKSGKMSAINSVYFLIFNILTV